MPQPIQKAVILAAGRGTRMKELTDEVPKPMIPVRGKPLLEYIIEGLAANGVTKFLIVVGWRKEVIIDHFGKGTAGKYEVEYVEQVRQDGTGKVVELGREFTGNDGFVLSYGDILVPAAAYAPLVDLEGDDARMTVKINEDVSKGGAVFIEDGMVVDLIEKGGPDAPQSPYYNAGIYTFAPVIYDFIDKLELSPRGEYELTDAIANMAKSGRKVRAVELEGDWADVRDKETLAELNSD
ncbi:MAG: dTDP-glucose pyrophosphorylase [Verrucomicrobiales bacterium]|jgi:dTDP-glucose pyrophosphorylase